MSVNHLGMFVFVITVAVVFAIGRGDQLRAPRSSYKEQPSSVDISAGAEEHNTIWVRIAVTLLVLLSALYVILSPRFLADQQKWAFGAVGTILGYWLKA